MITRSFLKEVTYQVVGAAIEVQKHLGPGLLESIYHQCMSYELTIRGLRFESELRIPVPYKEIVVETPIRCDCFIEGCLVAEYKAINEIPPIEDAKLISYMKLLQAPKGIMINFNCVNIFKEGQRTFVNEFFSRAGGVVEPHRTQ